MSSAKGDVQTVDNQRGMCIFFLASKAAQYFRSHGYDGMLWRRDFTQRWVLDMLEGVGEQTKLKLPEKVGGSDWRSGEVGGRYEELGVVFEWVEGERCFGGGCREGSEGWERGSSCCFSTSFRFFCFTLFYLHFWLHKLIGCLVLFCG